MAWHRAWPQQKDDMPELSHDQRLRLASYINLMYARPLVHADLLRRQRSGFTVPRTAQADGEIWQSGCWNWALTGGTGRARDPGNPAEIWKDIITQTMRNVYNNVDDPVVRTGINHVDASYPGSAADFTLLRANFAAASNGNPAAQNAFKEAMLRITARKNGLTVSTQPLASCTYTLHMKSLHWYSWEHMGIGISLTYRGAEHRTFVQTIPQDDIWHACSVMWDENLPETAIGLSSLLRAHVDCLDAVPMVCCICQAVPLGGLRPIRGWHRCANCSAAYCRTHKTALNVVRASSTFNPHSVRVCSRLGCVGHTRQI